MMYVNVYHQMIEPSNADLFHQNATVIILRPRVPPGRLSDPGTAAISGEKCSDRACPLWAHRERLYVI